MNFKAMYENVANELVNRILVLIPEHPEIMTIESPWDLFKVPGFKCDDLQPTLFQAGWALGRARQQYKFDNPPPAEKETK